MENEKYLLNQSKILDDLINETKILEDLFAPPGWEKTHLNRCRAKLC